MSHQAIGELEDQFVDYIWPAFDPVRLPFT
jgi:hypothetical protein